MSDQLRIFLEPRPHPYSNETTSRFQAWGRFTIVLLHEDGTRTTLLEKEWNLEVLADWFADHGHALCHAELVIGGLSPLPGEPIARAKDRIVAQHIDAEGDDYPDLDHASPWETESFAYYEAHSLNAALSGLDIPLTYIGLNHGSGEISLISDETLRSHSLDMDDFCIDFRDRLAAFVQHWVDTTDDEVQRVASELLARL